jgi:hypothetical protein
MFDFALMLELLDLSDQALLSKPSFVSTFTGLPSSLRGSPLRPQDTTTFLVRNPNVDTEGFTSISESGEIVLAFRGSEYAFTNKDGSVRDWVLTDFRSHRMIYPLAPGQWPNHNWVHTGFWLAYTAARATITNKITDLIKLNRNPKGRIHVTGFSLGGALAVIAAHDLAALGSEVVLYTFAAPRAGDGSFNKTVRAAVGDVFSVAIHGDPVVHLPPLGPNFPLTWHDINLAEIGPIDIPLVRLPQIGQEYQTIDDVIFVNRHNQLMHALPQFGIAINIARHNTSEYFKALNTLPPWNRVPPPVPGPKLSVETLHMMMQTT